MISRLRDKWRRDAGAALVIVASSIFLLMGMAAMGTDLAWFFLQSSRVQRAADASSLAGVIWMPGNQSTAFSTAEDVALRNGYDKDAADVTVTPATVPGQQNQLQVTIRHEVPTFFLKALGFDTMEIAQSAIAEYIPPLKLGSPDNQFGNSCDPVVFSNCGDNFWANIHGRWTDTRMGDAYASWCGKGQGSDNPSCTQNPLARLSGYLYGIESSSAFTLQFTDLAFRNISGGNPTSDTIRTGDRGCEDWGPSTSAACGQTMVVNLYAPDPTPLDLSDNGPPVCTATVPPQAQVLATAPYNWATPSGAACWTQSGPGTWVVQVTYQNPGSIADRSGLNRYSIRSTTGQLFALGDFSIYNNAAGSVTSFYLADVPDFYAGKTFVIELYDAGESSSTGALEVVGPDGNVWDDGECRIYQRTETTDPWNLAATISPGNDCYESVSPQEYNGRWLKYEIDLPTDYSCDEVAGLCWWKMNYNYPANVNDTTTWRAYIIGNPIHLTS